MISEGKSKSNPPIILKTPFIPRTAFLLSVNLKQAVEIIQQINVETFEISVTNIRHLHIMNYEATASKGSGKLLKTTYQEVHYVRI